MVAKSANRLILVEPPEVLQLEEVRGFRPVAEDAFLALVEVASGVVSVPVPSEGSIRGKEAWERERYSHCIDMKDPFLFHKYLRRVIRNASLSVALLVFTALISVASCSIRDLFRA